MTFRLYSNDLQDGAAMPEAQVFNGMGYQGKTCRRIWRGAARRRAARVSS
ncbi:putative kinase inhibitor protein [Serratia rubidaea]|uniref:Putative kinase inhibitor protein n=1 Tax=Serratia rubidaea TaxID=61652 RepID=A0A4U9HBQ1_SERRU|nr:putative kinase inhibitor protein [Serratia rubidaea]